MLLLKSLFIVLLIFWSLNYLPADLVPSVETSLFSLNNHFFILKDLLLLLVILWLISLFAYPLREISLVLVVLWLLSLFGYMTIPGLSVIITIIMIIGLLFYLIEEG